MNILRASLLALPLISATAGPAWADHHGHGRIGVYLGAPFGPWYYPPPYFFYPPQTIVVPAAPPPVYIEQSPAPPAAPAQTSYWYYCDAGRAYYPYVKECPGGWRAVLPQAPPR